MALLDEDPAARQGSGMSRAAELEAEREEIRGQHLELLDLQNDPLKDSRERSVDQFRLLQNFYRKSQKQKSTKLQGEDMIDTHSCCPCIAEERGCDLRSTCTHWGICTEAQFF